jgi:plastocyanin
VRKLAVFTGLVAAATLAFPVAGFAAGGDKKPPVTLEGEVNDEGTGTAKNNKISVEADDFYFDATYIKTKKGTLTVALENEGNAPHTFTIDSLDIDKEIQPGKKATVKVKVPSSSAVAFYCRFHKGQGMQGAVFTKAGASTTSSAANTGGATPTTKAPSTTGSSGYGY